MSIMNLLILCNDQVNPERDLALIGSTTECNHNNPAESGTVIAWKSNTTPPIIVDRIILWSSYRVVTHGTYLDNETVHLYCTLRGLYGTCITLSRSEHSSSMVPS